MALSAEQIADLVTTTQRELGKLRWTDMTGDLQEYVAMPKLLKKEKVQFQSGYGIQWNLMKGTSGAARNVGLFNTDALNVADQMITANIPWRHSTTSYAFERREIAMNREPARIVELIKTRRADAMIDLAKLCETDFWSKPTDSNDQVRPFGVKYWVVGNASEGFNGGNPSGFSAGAAGLDAATYPRWKNWTAEYAQIAKDDLVVKWRKAATFTKFMPPVEIKDYNRGDRYGYYTNYTVFGKLETILENQNDNLGNDLASKDGAVVFRKTPVTWVPELDADTTNPLYGLNWGVFFPVFLSGEYMREDPPEKAPNQHNVMHVFVDSTYNNKCTDRRRLFVLNQTA